MAPTQRPPSTQTNGSTNNVNRDRFPGHSKVNICIGATEHPREPEGTAGVNEVRQPLETEWSAFVPLDLGVPVLTVDTSNDHQLSLEEIVDWVWANVLAPLCP